jgi:hypothetical protein
MKQRVFAFLLCMAVTVASGYEDSDFDGVEDSRDQCPNTPFSELVDESGCTIASLVPLHHYDMITGLSFSQSDYQTLNQTDTLSALLQVDYYYKRFSMQFATSYYTTSGGGYSDRGVNYTFVGVSYELKPIQDVSLRVGGGVLLPTYKTTLNNNKTDYTVSLNGNYSGNRYNLFGGVIYTLVGDYDTVVVDSNTTSYEVQYQNTLSYNVGSGYNFNAKTYGSVAYNGSKSIYRGVVDIQTLSFYGYYSLDEHYFTTFSYAYGLSKSASQHYVALRFGYYF